MGHTSWDAIIIGGGVAGLSAAQMLGRARRRTLVIDAGNPRNRFTDHMHGVLGHDGIDPQKLLARGRAEAAAYGVVIEPGEVAGVDDQGESMRVRRADGAVDVTRTVVVTTGIGDELPDIPGLAAQWGRGVLHCPYCHGWEVTGRALGVLATSPSSIHQIELVRQWSGDVVAFTAEAGTLEPDVAERLSARGIRAVEAPVVEVVTHDERLVAVRTADGSVHEIDALFTAPVPRLDDGFLAGLDLARAEGAIVVDARGATSHPRVFAAGNVTAPYGNVPLSMGAGSMAGAGANAVLVGEDGARAVAAERRNAHWEAHYATEEKVWSGRVNATFAGVAESLTSGTSTGTALEVGSGEGADAVWLAERGWQVTGLDVSATAVRRATEAARARGLGEDRVVFLACDAAAALPEGPFDLVTASFLHSWEPDFPRIEILRAASARVAPGGALLVISHAAPPPWAREMAHEHPAMLSPAEELALLAPDPREWTVEIAEVRSRAATSPDGEPAHLDDGLLLLRRTPAA
ncbi:bifunctional NAD(P)/FAD-dependent oxidoreductase/class I SAM-dependent methyltransferase [Microbacterium invictum]|uniref:Thioredoxin reductase/SAM-dependent methyltransferase n=1 Tax=Microbacterium invictum TaxID=515415 RepID=A0AA40VP52_9MICO|nr:MULTISPECIES: bifunctional NAD(P)/FAD-dependent oxidoreductase/class I SAM-dependent methyltransferase [Microbacterium]MBB4141497.1 thioredoxin reductase/SAM-dependent methyltransferase [Microbacterium invictum]